MSSRFHVVVLTVLIAVVVSASAGLALEKNSARLTGTDDREIWRSGATTCSIAYYNTCTGWIWVWEGWSPTDRFGASFYRAYPTFSASLLTSWVHFSKAAPPGYGFTGVMDVWSFDPATECLIGSSLASQPYLPASGWNLVDFSGGGGVPVGHSFAITYTVPQTGDPLAPSSDHPAAGPTGPQACGTCFPNTRTNHSYFFAPGAMLCTGSSLNDGICDAQLLWDAQVDYSGVSPVDCNRVTPVEQESWGSIKSLYR